MRKKRILNKKVLKNSILKVFQEYPFKKFNYKQISKQINFKKIGEKILVYEALNELKSSGLLNEPKRGSYVLVKDAHKSPRPKDAPFPASVRSNVEGNNEEPSAETVDEEIKEVSVTDEVPNEANSTQDEGRVDGSSTEEKES